MILFALISFRMNDSDNGRNRKFETNLILIYFAQHIFTK
jgi:hypothetical protein